MLRVTVSITLLFAAYYLIPTKGDGGESDVPWLILEFVIFAIIIPNLSCRSNLFDLVLGSGTKCHSESAHSLLICGFPAAIVFGSGARFNPLASEQPVCVIEHEIIKHCFTPVFVIIDSV